MDMFSKGRTDALVSLGLVKLAAGVPILQRPSLWKRLGRWAQRKMPTRTGVRNFFIGDPRRFGQEIIKGKALSKGSLIRESFHAPDMFSKAMFYGLPAVEGVGVALDEEGNKARRIGETLGGAALGLAAYRPLGMLGSVGADVLGRRLGGGIGQTAAHLVGKATTPTPSTPVPQNLNVGSQVEPTYTYR